MFGPYGSSCGRAVAEAMAGRPAVIWNHGAADVGHAGARMVDVLGPAGTYWAGLPVVLAELSPTPRTAVVRAPGGFGAAVAAGAIAALTASGMPPVRVDDLDADGSQGAVSRARAEGADWIVGGGRLEDDLDLARACAGAGVSAALVVCGVALAGEVLGDAVLGWLGPAQWDGTPPPRPYVLPLSADYPAAQALAAGLVAERALALAGSAEPDALWAAARALRTSTLIGPFAIDDRGRQRAHSPCLVRWCPGVAGPERRVVWRPGASIS